MKLDFVCLNCTKEFAKVLTESNHVRKVKCPDCGSSFVQQNIQNWPELLSNRTEKVSCGSKTLCDECGLCSKFKGSQNIPKVVLTAENEIKEPANLPPPPTIEEHLEMPWIEKKATRIIVKKADDKKDNNKRKRK